VADAAMPARRTSPIELLWDLVFVFAVTQVSTLLARDLSWAGFGRAMLVLALVWWAWSAFVWSTNAQDPNSGMLRGVLLLATLLIFLVGLALPRAFGSEGLLFALAYTGVRFLHLALYVDASRHGNASLSAIAGFSATVAIGMALLVGGAFTGGVWRIVLWTLAVAIDYAGPAWLTRERLRGLQRVAVEHFAERYSLFIIICLGESIVAIGFGAGGRPLEADLIATVSLALLITIGLWWVYFDRFAAIAEERLRTHDDPVLAAADAYSYIHLVLVAGIIVFAVGAGSAVAHANEAFTLPSRIALWGGVALYLAGQVGFQMRMVRRLSLAMLAAIAVIAIVFAFSGGFPAWAAAAALTLVLTALLAWERVEARVALSPRHVSGGTTPTNPSSPGASSGTSR
jgi:low temperature requirement protein LtrA